MDSTLTESQKTASISKAFIVADAIKDAGEAGVSSGYLFSIVKDCLSKDELDFIIIHLKNGKMITEDKNVFYWIQRNFCNKKSILVSKDECDACYNNDPNINLFTTPESCRKKNIEREIR